MATYRRRDCRARIASLSRLPEARQGLLDAIAAEEQRTAERRANVKRAMRWHRERGKDFPPRSASEHYILAEVQAEMASDGVAAGSSRSSRAKRDGRRPHGTIEGWHRRGKRK